MRMMKAAVLRAHDRGIEIEELPIPSPKPHQVLVRILASGLCQTDLHAIRGTWEKKPVLPLIPGHEGVGVIEEVGSKVTSLKMSQKILIPWIGKTCRSCSPCVAGRENYCEKQMNTGYVLPGTHAEYTVADARHVVELPEGMNPVLAAPLACAGLTAFEAVKSAAANGRESLLVTGVGGVGHLALQYAKAIFAKVFALDESPVRVVEANALGAESFTTSQWREMQVRSKVDAAVVCVADENALLESFRAIRNGGTLVLVGLGKPKNLVLPWFGTVTRGIRVIGAYVGPITSLREVVEIHHEGKAHVEAESRPLKAISQALEDLASGANLRPRIVLVP